MSGTTTSAVDASRGDSSDAFLGATRSSLSSRPRGGPPWLAARRSEAAARIEAAGLPSPNDEAFRVTQLSRVLRTAYSLLPGARVASPFDGLSLARVRLDNGRVETDGIGALDGLEVRTLADVLAKEPALVEPHLGRLAALEDGFVAQNTALFEDGLVVVARGRKKPTALHVAYSGSATKPAFATPRVLVIAEPGSQLDLVESHAASGEYLESSVTEVFVGANARVEHVRVELGSERGGALATIAVRQGKDSRYLSRIFGFGGKLTRVDVRVELSEEGAETSLDGLFLAGRGALVDHHTSVVHASPRCTSRQRYKGVADSDGVGIFDGTVVVRSGASGTEAHQESRNLLLSNDAIIHAKPHLEIDTDDVRCSHGATIGRLDAAQLFYLRSRGIDATVARSLLTYAFAREVTASVSDATVRAVLEDLIAARLPSGDRAKELA